MLDILAWPGISSGNGQHFLPMERDFFLTLDAEMRQWLEIFIKILVKSLLEHNLICMNTHNIDKYIKTRNLRRLWTLTDTHQMSQSESQIAYDYPIEK